MVQDAIEAILKQELGLNAGSMGSSTIARIIKQRQKACGLPDALAYLAHLQSSRQELENLIEAIVVPETWFFRDQAAFDYLKGFAAKEWRNAYPNQVMRILSAPCSTGEEPYSIAIALLEAGLAPHEFRIDAVDISKIAISKAKRAIYSKNSFRGNCINQKHRYFQSVDQGWSLSPFVRETVNFIRGNLLASGFLSNRKYHAIFCRNLFIYLDAQARSNLSQLLDQALLPDGLLFVTAVEIPQFSELPYQLVDQVYAYRKRRPTSSASSSSITTPKVIQPKPLRFQSSTSPNLVSPLETAKQLANQGQLAQAMQLCKTYLNTRPSDDEAYLLLGEIYQGMNQPDNAERCWHNALYLNPNQYEALLHLALIKEQHGDLIASERLKQRAQRLLNSSP